jgi:hypothetical protein
VFPFVWTLGPLFLMVYMEFQKRFHFEVKKTENHS